MLLGISIIILLELLLYGLVRQIVVIYENLFVWVGEKARLRQQMKNAETYSQWVQAARRLDTYFGRDQWQRMAQSPLYDWKLIRDIVRQLRKFRLGSESLPNTVPANLEKLVDLCLESSCKNNVGGVENEVLYSQAHFGTKDLVQEYVQETLRALDALSCAPVQSSNGRSSSCSWRSSHEKRAFFKKASRLYGRSALCLSGGAAFGYYHLGVVKALLLADSLPKVITGTSAGSLIAAVVCTRTDAELKILLEPEVCVHFTACDESWITRLRRLFQEGVLFSRSRWEAKMDWVTQGDTTFAEAYARTGRILNITVVSTDSHSPPKLLNHRTSPNVVIWSAVLASSAVPGIIEPVQLMIKKINEFGKSQVIPFTGWGDRWQDGSLRIDM
jgi:hypothetical protein